LIPLSALYFDDKGNLNAERWPRYNEFSDEVKALCARLVKQGTLRPGKAPPGKPAFLATAVTPGGSRVLIEIEISGVTPDDKTPENSTTDFTVTETDTYAGLGIAKLTETIGTAANGGNRPGLVYVSSAGAPALPQAMTPAVKMYGDPATVDIPANSGGGTAFTLKTRSGGADAAQTTIEIRDVDVTNQTFTLVARWTKTSNAVAMKDLATSFGYVTEIKAPAGGYLAPAAGKIVLSGGADAVALDAVKASATVLTP
jgi:hypothetical protein